MLCHEELFLGKQLRDGWCILERVGPIHRMKSVREDQEQHRDTLLELLRESYSLSARELAYRLNIGLPSIHRLISEDLGLVKKQAQWYLIH